MTRGPLLTHAAPAVSVVVPTFRRPHLLRRCLVALIEQRLGERDFEVIVVDDGRDAVTEAVVAELAADTWRPQLRYLRPHAGRGPATARNCGWRVARAPVVAFTDDDTIPAPDWLAAGLAALKPDEVALAGAIRVPIPTPPTDHQWNTYGLESAEFATANAFVRRDALERVGGFDERFTRAWREDSDLQFSLIELGGRIGRCQEALVIHPVRPEGWGVSLRQQRNAMFEALLYKKHPRLYRDRISPTVPWSRYAMVACGLCVPPLLVAGKSVGAAACLAFVAGTIARITADRLRYTERSRAHIFEMIVTSAVIPFLSVYWRVRGALRHRVLFL